MNEGKFLHIQFNRGVYMKNMLIGISILFGFYYIFFFDTIPAGWEMVFKLIPMLLFIALALYQTKRNDHYAVFICIGLIFCAVGDYTLQWFIVGLTFFLTGHLFYIIAFSRHKGTLPLYAKVLFLLYGLVMAVSLMSTLLQKGETVLSFAVLAYIAIILTMGWTAMKTNNRFTMVAALLFIFSDSTLAINRFMVDVPAAHELIMLSYYSAQLLFAISIGRHTLKDAKEIGNVVNRIE